MEAGLQWAGGRVSPPSSSVSQHAAFVLFWTATSNVFHGDAQPSTPVFVLSVNTSSAWNSQACFRVIGVRWAEPRQHLQHKFVLICQLIVEEFCRGGNGFWEERDPREKGNRPAFLRKHAAPGLGRSLAPRDRRTFRRERAIAGIHRTGVSSSSNNYWNLTG